MAAPIAPWGTPGRLGALATLVGLALSPPALAQETQNPAPPIPDASVTCDVLVVGGGLAGTATAYEALRAGRTVCLTDITDWVGGQISSQGTTALDEVGRQRALLFYAQGYLALRDRIPELYDGDLNPGDCWVSATCFLPADAHQILSELLLAAAESGGGELKWFPHTVAKDVTYSADGRQIASLTAIQHQAAPGTPPLNTEPLSAIIADAYRYGDSDRLTKTVVEFVPAEDRDGPADWYVIEATETGELIGLTQIPHRLGLDARSPLDPSSPVTANDPYCTQGFTYTFAMAATAEPQPHPLPDFYAQYAPYFSYERARSGVPLFTSNDGHSIAFILYALNLQIWLVANFLARLFVS
jgi:hypothetical protein